jgi:hypothetical protein
MTTIFTPFVSMPSVSAVQVAMAVPVLVAVEEASVQPLPHHIDAVYPQVE